MSKLTLEQIKHLSTICEKTISVYPSDDYEVSEKPVNRENFFHLEQSESLLVRIVLLILCIKRPIHSQNK